MTEAVATQLIDSLAYIIAAGIAALAALRQHKITKANEELQETLKKTQDKLEKTEDLALSKSAIADLLQSFEVQDQLRDMVQDIKMSTPIDRVLGFYAVNGLYKPERTSMFFNDVDREWKHLLGSYKFWPIGESYQNRLKEAELQGSAHVDVAALPVYDEMKTIYMSEKVRYALWIVSGRIPLDSVREMVVYFSFSTHLDEPLDGPEVFVSCQSFVAQIQKLMDSGNLKLELDL